MESGLLYKQETSPHKELRMERSWFCIIGIRIFRISEADYRTDDGIHCDKGLHDMWLIITRPDQIVEQLQCWVDAGRLPAHNMAVYCGDKIIFERP